MTSPAFTFCHERLETGATVRKKMQLYTLSWCSENYLMRPCWILFLRVSDLGHTLKIHRCTSCKFNTYTLLDQHILLEINDSCLTLQYQKKKSLNIKTLRLKQWKLLSFSFTRLNLISKCKFFWEKSLKSFFFSLQKQAPILSHSSGVEFIRKIGIWIFSDFSWVQIWLE